MTYHPPPYPTPGRFVAFHHAEDVWDWPALILQVRVSSMIGVEGSIVFGGVFVPNAARDRAGLLGAPGTSEFHVWDPIEDPLPTDWHIDCQLQVFRPRANDWRWVSEGPGAGNWSWPNAYPSNPVTPITKES